MFSKKALAVLAILALGFIVSAPLADVSAEDEPEMVYTTVQPALEDASLATDGDNAKGGNNFFYDCVLVLIIALIAAGGLHMKAHKN